MATAGTGYGDRQRNQKRGQRGEEAARHFLEAQGYRIVALNWRCPGGEIDIIAQDADTLVFVEVRARQVTEDAFASVTPRKQTRLLNAVHAYVNANALENAVWRVDVIAVGLAAHPPTIEHGVDALDW